ncbi:MAG: glycosyltransferase [Acidobacteriota bacterium]|nr:MAG: glycosyltransferase [Acidobacteriota bacterium]
MRDGFVRSGVPADRIEAVPNGVDKDWFQPEGERFELETAKSFKLLFVGGTTPRRGIDLLLSAHLRAFSASDDVCLVIKDMGVGSFYKGQTSQELIRRCQRLAGGPEIVYLDGSLTARELAGLYRACDALVHPYRGEGFGLPIAEAMASALPVIVTDHGAARDFCHARTAYLIPARATGRAARERVVSSLLWRHAADAANERLARIVERPIRR